MHIACICLYVFIYACPGNSQRSTVHVHVCICLYLSVYVCMTESTCITRLNTVQINSFIASTPASRVVCGPNHGPRVDVEQLAGRSLRESGVQTHSRDKTSKCNVRVYKYTHTELYIHICTFILSHFSLYQPKIHAHTCIYMQVQTHTY